MRARSFRPLLGFVASGALAFTALNVDPRLELRLDPSIRDKVQAFVDSAAKAGLETEPLVDLALEVTRKIESAREHGRRLSFGMERVVELVRAHWGEMKQARQALGPLATPQEVTAGASALKAGVSVKHLERLRSAPKGQKFAMALNTMTELAMHPGVPKDTAAAAIVSLVLASATEEQISSLQSDVLNDLRAGLPAGAAITARADGLERVIAAQAHDGGVPGTALPSARGTMRSVDPAASGPVAGTPAGSKLPGSAGEGPRPPAPRGRDPKRP